MTAVDIPFAKPRITSISAVFPAYNDGGTIASMILAAVVALAQVTNDYEVIVTNDGSLDYTPLVLGQMTKMIPELRTLHHLKNQGYGAALRTGFAAASKDWIFYTDGDAQYNPLELVKLAAEARENVDVVNGYKISRGDSFFRKIIGRLYHHAVKLCFGFHLRDVNCDFRLFRRSLLNSIELESVSGTFGLELVTKFQRAGHTFVEVPVHHYPRPYGASQFINPRHLFTTTSQLITLWVKMVDQKRTSQSSKTDENSPV